MEFFKRKAVLEFLLAVIIAVIGAFLYDFFDLKPRRSIFAMFEDPLATHGTSPAAAPETPSPDRIVPPAASAQIRPLPQPMINVPSAKALVEKYLAAQRWNLVAQGMGDTSFSCAPADCTVQHQLVGIHQRMNASGNSVLLFFATANAHSSCPECAAALSAFEVAPVNESLSIVDTNLAFATAGSAGQWRNTIQFESLGKDRLGVLIAGDFAHDGQVEIGQRVFLMEDPGIRRVLSIATGGMDPHVDGVPDNHWRATLKIEPSNKEYYNIRLTTRGVKDGKTESSEYVFAYAAGQYHSPGWTNPVPRSALVPPSDQARDLAQAFLLKQDWVSISKRMEGSGFYCEPDECSVHHDLLGAFPLQRHPNKDTMVIFFATSNTKVVCRACTAALSEFEMSASNGKWSIADANVAFTSGGQWGKWSGQGMTLQKIGGNKFAALESLGWSAAQGVVGDSEVIFLLTDPGVKEVLSIMTAQNTVASGVGEPDDWHAVVKIVPSSKEYFDISVTTHGLRGGKSENGTHIFSFGPDKYLSPTWKK